MNKQNVISAAVVALVVSVLAGIVFRPSAPSVAPASPEAVQLLDVGALSFPVHNTPEVFLGGVGNPLPGSALDSLNGSISGVIAAGSNQGHWKNKTGRTVLIDEADISFASGVASSSMLFSISTSSSETALNDFTAPFGSLIDAKNLATSTDMTGIVINSLKDGGTNGREVIDVNPGESVFILMRQTNPNVCTGSACENATSTNRGFGAMSYYLRGHYKP